MGESSLHHLRVYVSLCSFSSASRPAASDMLLCCCSVSNAYKESANCRLEANYAMQNDCDMIPVSRTVIVRVIQDPNLPEAAR